MSRKNFGQKYVLGKKNLDKKNVFTMLGKKIKINLLSKSFGPHKFLVKKLVTNFGVKNHIKKQFVLIIT